MRKYLVIRLICPQTDLINMVTTDVLPIICFIYSQVDHIS